MSKPAHAKYIWSKVLDHPAVQAWSQLHPERVRPDWIESLKGRWERTRTSTVYRLAGVGLQGSDVIAKRCRRACGASERIVYERVLPHLPVPTPHYYGFVEEPDADFCCLFVEDAGENIYSPEVEEHRTLAARWVGILHASAARLNVATCLPDRGPAHYLAHLRAACGTILQNMANPALTADDVEVLKTIVSHCEILASRWGQVERFCDGVPRTLVHGDFKKNNVRIRANQGRMQFVAFDWEYAGWGVPAEDLAALQPTVDMSVYWSVARDHWPHMDFEAAQRLLFVGKVFRCAATIDWETGKLAYEWVEKPMFRMRFYLSQLGTLLGATAWGS
ncbi:MAG: aminoglycoside phosphotransferase family protein [Chloroflexi bacterium]|nr:aminoglycoside phosphotransferase family protein [Chloroflexota bacterium]